MTDAEHRELDWVASRARGVAHRLYARGGFRQKALPALESLAEAGLVRREGSPLGLEYATWHATDAGRAALLLMRT